MQPTKRANAHVAADFWRFPGTGTSFLRFVVKLVASLSFSGGSWVAFVLKHAKKNGANVLFH